MKNQVTENRVVVIKEAYALGFTTAEIGSALELANKAVKSYQPTEKQSRDQVYDHFENYFVHTADFSLALEAWKVAPEIKSILLESKAIKRIQKDLADAKLFHMWQGGLSQREIAVVDGCAQSYVSRKIQRYNGLHKAQVASTKTAEVILRDVRSMNPVPPYASALGLLAEQYKVTMEDIKQLLADLSIDLVQELQVLRDKASQDESEALTAQVIELYNQGLTQQQIGDVVGVNQWTVSRILTPIVGLQNKRVLNTELEPQIVEAIVGGASDAEVKELFNISHFTLNNIKLRNKLIKPRNTDKVKAQIRRLSSAGKKPRVIAKELNLKSSFVYYARWQQKNGADTESTTSRTAPNLQACVAALYTAGNSYERICTLTGLPYTTVNGIIQRKKVAGIITA